MTSHSSVTIGEFSCADAFAVARTLEHAGISTELKVDSDTYRVAVAQEHAARAFALV